MPENEFFIDRVDPNRPFTMSGDATGSSIVLTVRVPSFLAGAVGELVSDPHTPYKKQAEILRDAVYQMCYWWSQQLKAGASPSLTRCMTLADIEMRKENRDRDERSIKGLEEESTHLDPRNRDGFVANVLFARVNAPPDMQKRVKQIMDENGIEDL